MLAASMPSNPALQRGATGYFGAYISRGSSRGAQKSIVPEKPTVNHLFQNSRSIGIGEFVEFRCKQTQQLPSDWLRFICRLIILPRLAAA